MNHIDAYRNIIMALLLALTPLLSLAEEEEAAFAGDVYRLSGHAADAVVSAVKEAGGDCWYNRDDLYLLMYPADMDIDKVIKENEAATLRMGATQSPQTSVPELAERLRRAAGFPSRRGAVPSMETARQAFGADRILSGQGLPRAFDGSGVVVGLCDVGFDALHPNFLSADGHESRVRLCMNYDVRNGERRRYDTPESIRDFATDNPSNYHATHVAGILAGRGTSGATHASLAPGSDVVAVTSSLQDVEILAGVEDIIAYARSVGKPCVINLSLGYYGGPHDGTSLFCQYLDRCAEDAIICLSTGNEGQGHNHIGHTFARDDEELFFRPYDRTWDYRDVAGSIDMYAPDATPMKLAMRVQDTASAGRPVVYSTPMIDFTQTPVWALVSDPALEALDPAVHYEAGFAEYFDGIILLYGELDPENGKYHVKAEWVASTDIPFSEEKKWGRYQLAGALMAPAGTKVDLYADGILSAFQTAGVTVQPDSENSFSDLCTGRNTISVGAYAVEESVTTMTGDPHAGGSPMTVCGWSSYGVTSDGRVMPLTIAPGAPIVSSFSGHYVEENGLRYCIFEDAGAYWGVENGTSMSTPYVASGIATWLQANPDLTYADVQRILAATNRVENFSPDADPRHGQGAFDPYAGLKMVLENTLTSVTEICGSAIFAEFARSGGEGMLTVFNPEEREVAVEVCSPDGRRLALLAAGHDARISVPSAMLNPSGYHGVAICRVTVPGGKPEILKILL